jgi:hypothetical protein
LGEAFFQVTEFDEQHFAAEGIFSQNSSQGHKDSTENFQPIQHSMHCIQPGSTSGRLTVTPGLAIYTTYIGGFEWLEMTKQSGFPADSDRFSQEISTKTRSVDVGPGVSRPAAHHSPAKGRPR